MLCSLLSLLLNEVPDQSNFRMEGVGLRVPAQSTMMGKSQGKSKRKLAVTSSQETKRMNVLGLLSLFYSLGDASLGNGTAHHSPRVRRLLFLLQPSYSRVSLQGVIPDLFPW